MSDEMIRKSVLAKWPRLQKTKPSSNLSSSKSVCKFKENRDYEVSDFDMESYLTFLSSDKVISVFFHNDVCFMMSDSYLLAAVFSYFRWSGLDQWTRRDFFALLYLAVEIEEEISESKWEMLPYALGDSWMAEMKSFIRRKNELFRRMNFRGIVSKHTCVQVMDLKPNHSVWRRIRQLSHGGAHRSKMGPEEYCPSGPNKDPLPCVICGKTASKLHKRQPKLTKAIPGLDMIKSPEKRKRKHIDENNNRIYINKDHVERIKLEGLRQDELIQLLLPDNEQ